MIDFHTHVLPGIDDGAKNEEMASTLLKEEIFQGVTQLVFTPHYYGKRRTVEQFLQLRQDAFKSIESVVPEVLETRLGAEVHMTGVNDPTDEALIKLAIEGTNLVLVEFPFHGKWHHSLFERLEDFILNTGYTPVVAHVERYEQVYAQPAVLTQLVQMGCLLQVNASAFLEKRWKKLAFALLKKGMVHCMGTDAHNVTTRKPDYRQAKEVIQASKYAGRWQEIQDCMEKLLKGETVEVEPKRIKKFLGLYL